MYIRIKISVQCCLSALTTTSFRRKELLGNSQQSGVLKGRKKSCESKLANPTLNNQIRRVKTLYPFPDDTHFHLLPKEQDLALFVSNLF